MFIKKVIRAYTFGKFKKALICFLDKIITNNLSLNAILLILLLNHGEN